MSEQTEVSVWWPFPLLGGLSAPLFVIGVIGYHHLVGGYSPQDYELALMRARALKEFLEQKGFTVEIKEFPRAGVAVIDFHDPELIREVIEAGEFIDRRKVERYIPFGAKGSVSFDSRGITEGDIPVITLRRPDVAKGLLRVVLTPPKAIEITDVHLHGYDHLPSTHIHIAGVDLTLEDLEELADFIAKARGATRMFLTVPGV